MASYARLAKKLQSAINQRAGVKLLINTQQWYSKEHERTITTYIVKQSLEDDEGKFKQNIELFRTYSHVQLVLYLRDYWYELNDWEVPADNEKWEEVKIRANTN